tara:strand:+ start:354 stop:575 length:222 start_codon:yes stop_codon:yes gene_type:complete
MCVNDEQGAPICDDNGVPFGGFAPSTKLLELQALGPSCTPLHSPMTLIRVHPLILAMQKLVAAAPKEDKLASE